jgi:Helix-turn-helix domain
MRERVIESVEAGASRREAAEIFGVSVASAVKWVQRWREQGSAAAKPRGGSPASGTRRNNPLIGIEIPPRTWCFQNIDAIQQASLIKNGPIMPNRPRVIVQY